MEASTLLGLASLDGLLQPPCSTVWSTICGSMSGSGDSGPASQEDPPTTPCTLVHRGQAFWVEKEGGEL